MNKEGSWPILLIQRSQVRKFAVSLGGSISNLSKKRWKMTISAQGNRLGLEVIPMPLPHSPLSCLSILH